MVHWLRAAGAVGRLSSSLGLPRYGSLTSLTSLTLHSGQDPSTYLDQSDFFYDSPSKYLLNRFPSSVDPSFPPSPFPSARYLPHTSDLGWRHEWPSHLVLFDALVPELQGLLEAQGYREQTRLWNSHWHEDDRRRGDVVVWRWHG